MEYNLSFTPSSRPSLWENLIGDDNVDLKSNISSFSDWTIIVKREIEGEEVSSVSCDDFEIKVHRCILSCRSRFFKALWSDLFASGSDFGWTSEMKDTTVLNCPEGCFPHHIRLVLQFIYGEPLKIPPNSCLPVLKAADFLLVDDLAESISSKLKGWALSEIESNPKMVLDLYKSSLYLDLTDVSKSLALIIAEDFEKLFVNEEISKLPNEIIVRLVFDAIQFGKMPLKFLSPLPLELLLNILQSDSLPVKTEDQVYFFIRDLLLLPHKTSSQIEPSSCLWNVVRFPFLSPETLRSAECNPFVPKALIMDANRYLEELRQGTINVKMSVSKVLAKELFHPRKSYRENQLRPQLLLEFKQPTDPLTGTVPADPPTVTQEVPFDPNSKLVSMTKQILQSYLSFFSHISLRSGWRSVAFSKEDVEPLFWNAARICAEIRTLQDEIDPEFKIRRIDGNAQAYLWNVQGVPSSFVQKHRFIVELIHATFSDGTGYLPGYSQPMIDHLIELSFVDSLQAPGK